MKKLVFALAPILLVALIALVALSSLHSAPVVSAHTALPMAACSETGLTGSAQQENMLFCQGAFTGSLPDGGFVYLAAIRAAGDNKVIVGTPIGFYASVDWHSVAITYVEFSSGFHAEYHSDNVVRIYNTLNQQVFP